jgi:hypothetical protein
MQSRTDRPDAAICRSRDAHCRSRAFVTGATLSAKQRNSELLAGTITLRVLTEAFINPGVRSSANGHEQINVVVASVQRAEEVVVSPDAQPGATLQPEFLALAIVDESFKPFVGAKTVLRVQLSANHLRVFNNMLVLD